MIKQTLQIKLKRVKNLISWKANHLPAYINVADKLLSCNDPCQWFAWLTFIYKSHYF